MKTPTKENKKKKSPTAKITDLNVRKDPKGGGKVELPDILITAKSSEQAKMPDVIVSS